MESAQLSTNQDVALSDLKKLIVECYQTWFSDLTVMGNEVRDRTFLVMVHGEMYISDLFVHQVFSEVGWIEKFSYMSVESGFKYRVCFRDAYAANCAFNYYSGKRCDRFEVFLVNEVISTQVQEMFDGFRQTIHKKSPKIDEALRPADEFVQEGAEGFKASNELSQDEGVAQIETKNGLIVAKELSDAFPKEFAVSIDDTLGQEAHLLSWNEEKDNLKGRDIADSRIEDKMVGHVRDLCFDPGGEYLMVASYGLLEKTDVFASSLGGLCIIEGIDDELGMQDSVNDLIVLYKFAHCLVRLLMRGGPLQSLHEIDHVLSNSDYKVLGITQFMAGSCTAMLIFNPGGGGLLSIENTLQLDIAGWYLRLVRCFFLLLNLVRPRAVINDCLSIIFYLLGFQQLVFDPGVTHKGAWEDETKATLLRDVIFEGDHEELFEQHMPCPMRFYTEGVLKDEDHLHCLQQFLAHHYPKYVGAMRQEDLERSLLYLNTNIMRIIFPVVASANIFDYVDVFDPGGKWVACGDFAMLLLALVDLVCIDYSSTWLNSVRPQGAAYKLFGLLGEGTIIFVFDPGGEWSVLAGTMHLISLNAHIWKASDEEKFQFMFSMALEYSIPVVDAQSYGLSSTCMTLKLMVFTDQLDLDP